MTSAAGKWHKHDMHVWLRSARAVLELHANLGKQRWFPSPTQDQHVSVTQSKAFTAAPGGQKQAASTDPTGAACRVVSATSHSCTQAAVR